MNEILKLFDVMVNDTIRGDRDAKVSAQMAYHAISKHLSGPERQELTLARVHYTSEHEAAFRSLAAGIKASLQERLI